MTLLRDRELRAKYEQAAAKLAAQYDWPAIGDKFASVLEELTESQVGQSQGLPVGRVGETGA